MPKDPKAQGSGAGDADPERTQRLLRVPLRAAMDDDAPTVLHEPSQEPALHVVKEQRLSGATIREISENAHHALSRALSDLLARARRELPGASIDERATLELRHEFEFERRVGYRLELRLFDAAGRSIDLSAEIDQDGESLRPSSIMARLMEI